MKCDADADSMLSPSEMTACLTSDAALQISLSTLLPADILNMQALMDVVTNFSLFDYIFLRRVNNAINNCGDNGIIQP